MADRRHRDRVDHLLVELRVALRRRQAVLRHDRAVVQVDRRVEAPLGRIVVDDLEVLADRAGLEDVLPFVVALPGNASVDLVDPGRLELDAELGSKAKTRSGRSRRVGAIAPRIARFSRSVLRLRRARRLLDLVADEPCLGVDEQRAAGRARRLAA